MRILFVCENYLPHIGGVEVVFKNLAERMVELGNEVNLVTHQLKGTKKYEIINGGKVHRVSCFNSRYLFSLFSIPKILKLAKKADIIQTTTFNGAPPSWFVGKLLKKPTIITVHEVWINKWNKVTDFSKLKCFIHNLLEKAIYSLKFDQYVTVSNATKKDLEQIGIKPEKIKTIHNGFDYDFWDPDNFNGEIIRKKLNLENKWIYFAWGRPGPSKGFEYAIKAVPKIKKHLKNSLFLLMLGSADQYKQREVYFKKLIKELNLTDDEIKIIPSVPYNELGNYLKAADCLVVPSIAEGFGYTTVEANSMNKPLVASNTGSIPEVISGKHLLFESKNSTDLANCVIKIHDNKFHQTQLKKFLWGECVEKYLEVYGWLK